MIHPLALDFFVLCAFFSPLLAQNTYFTTPPPAGAELSFNSDPVYAINSQVQLGWVTNVGSYSIWLWQQAGGQLGSATCGSQIYTKADGQTEAGGTIWDVTTQNFLLSASNVFFLALGPYGNLTDASTSHYFNITNAASTTSSTSASSSTSTAAPTSSLNSASSSTSTIAASSINSGPSGTATPATTSSASVHGSSNATTVGLGVGLGVGIPIILLLSALLCLKIRKAKGANRMRQDLAAYQEENSPSSELMAYNKRQPVELPVEMTPHLQK